MFIHNLNPVIINFGFLEIRWYSLAYIVGIFLGFYYAKYLIKKYWDKEKINTQNLDNFLIYLILGIIIGGRFGYILFYITLTILSKYYFYGREGCLFMVER